MLKELQKLANHLDEIGEIKLADKLDSIIASNIKLAEMPTRKSVQKGIDFSQEEQVALNIWNKKLLSADLAKYKVGDPDDLDVDYYDNQEDDFMVSHVSRLWSDPNFSATEGGRGFKEAVLREIPNFDWLIRSAIDKINAKSDGSQAKATRTGGPLQSIQTLVGAEATGKWNRDTRDNLESFLTKYDKHLVPEGTAGVKQVMSWGSGFRTISVEGVSKPGSYPGNWGGLLKLLKDLESKDQSALSSLKALEDDRSTEYVAPAWLGQSVTEPTAVANKAMDDVVSSLSSAFSSGMPKFSR